MKYGLKDKYTRDFLSIIDKFQDVDKVVLFGSRAMEKHKNWGSRYGYFGIALNK